MTFETELFDWIDRSLSEPIDKSVIAFCFNLHEPYGIELIGASEFDPENDDWACTETFEPSQRDMDIPRSECAGGWEECLQTMSSYIKKYLTSNRPGVKILLASKAVAIGFVDGDLKIIHLA